MILICRTHKQNDIDWPTYDTISCFLYMRKFTYRQIPYYPGALRFALWTKVAGNQRNSVLEICTGFNQSGTSLSQSFPDLLLIRSIHSGGQRSPSLGTSLVLLHTVSMMTSVQQNSAFLTKFVLLLLITFFFIPFCNLQRKVRCYTRFSFTYQKCIQFTYHKNVM